MTSHKSCLSVGTVAHCWVRLLSVSLVHWPKASKSRALPFSTDTVAVINSTRLMRAPRHVSAVFFAAVKSNPHGTVQRRGGGAEEGEYEDNLSLCRRSPVGEITQDDDIIKSACTEGGKGKSGRKRDGIETRDGWVRFELERSCFNASVMAADGFNPAAGSQFFFFFL